MWQHSFDAQVDQYLLEAPFIDQQTPHFIDIGGNDILALLLSVGCPLESASQLLTMQRAWHQASPTLCLFSLACLSTVAC